MFFSCFICALIGLQVKYSVWKKTKNSLCLGDISVEIPASMPSRRGKVHLVERFKDLHRNLENVERSLGQVSLWRQPAQPTQLCLWHEGKIAN